jgi:hypothetical protein
MSNRPFIIVGILCLGLLVVGCTNRFHVAYAPDVARQAVAQNWSDPIYAYERAPVTMQNTVLAEDDALSHDMTHVILFAEVTHGGS